MRRLVLLCVLLAGASPAFGQSLFLKDGDRAAIGSVGWSVGPQSTGVETFVGASLNGRIDVGFGMSHYKYTYDDGSVSKFNEWAPFVRVFLVKEGDDNAPVSLAVHGQFFIDDYATSESGNYVQAGATLYKSLKLSDEISIHPFLGFSFVDESYTPAPDSPTDRQQYLERDLGVHVTTRTDRPWFLQLTLIEESFRKETYRGARLAYVRKF
jgi:hypothetical protein